MRHKFTIILLFSIFPLMAQKLNLTNYKLISGIRIYETLPISDTLYFVPDILKIIGENKFTQTVDEGNSDNSLGQLSSSITWQLTAKRIKILEEAYPSKLLLPIEFSTGYVSVYKMNEDSSESKEKIGLGTVILQKETIAILNTFFNTVNATIFHSILKEDTNVKNTLHYAIQLISKQKQTFHFGLKISQGNIISNLHISDVDDFYKQRDVHFFLDGDVNGMEDFNFARVTIKKDHASRQDFIYEIVLMKDQPTQKASYLLNNRYDKYNFKYKVVWHFRNSSIIEMPWKESKWSGVSLRPPVDQGNVVVELDPVELDKKNIRIVELNLFYYLGKEKKSKTTRLSNKKSSSEIVLLKDQGTSVEYSYTYITKSGSEKESTKYILDENDNFIFINNFE